MVKYQDFVSLVFEIARERGRRIDSLSDSQQYLETAAQLWTENKEVLKGFSAREARNWLEQNA